MHSAYLRSTRWAWEIKISPKLRNWYTKQGFEFRECPGEFLDKETWTWMSLPPHLCKVLTDSYKGISKETHFWWNDDPKATRWDKKDGSGGIWFDILPSDPDCWRKLCIKNNGEKPTTELPMFMHVWHFDPQESVVRVVS